MNIRHSGRHAICRGKRQVFPGTGEMWKVSHVSPDDVLVAQLAGSARRVIEFAVKDILGACDHSHTTSVAQLAQTSLSHDGDEVIWAGGIKHGGDRDMVPPRDSKDGAEASAMKNVDTVVFGWRHVHRVARGIDPHL